MDRQRWWRDHPRVADGLLAGLVCAVDLTFAPGLTAGSGSGWALLIIALSLPYGALFWRRRAPILVLAVMLGQMIGWAVLISFDIQVLGVLVALYSVSTYRRLAISAGSAVVVGVVLGVIELFDEFSRPFSEVETPAAVVRFAVVGSALNAAAGWGFGRFARGTRRHAANQRELAELQRREAVRTERATLAHDLHDVVAHAVVMMMLGTSAARFQLGPGHEQAAATLADVEQAGARAMSELRAMLDVLRAVDAAAVLVATDAALAGVGPLVESARRAGLAVTERHAGDPRPLARAVDLAAQRIVQESLTNVMKHAGPGSSVTIEITWGSERLALRIGDDGGGRVVQTEAHRSAGVGLAGLRERAASAGGQLRAGPVDGGGFEVVAELPVAAGTPGTPAQGTARVAAMPFG